MNGKSPVEPTDRAVALRASSGSLTSGATPSRVALIQDSALDVASGVKISPLASGSVRVHIARGVAGLVAFVGACVGATTIGPVALLLLLVAGVAWRGCPTCWTVGLMHTRDGAGCRLSQDPT